MRTLARWIIVGSLSACGARTELRVTAPDAIAAADAVTPDVVRPADVPSPVDAGAPVDAPIAPACTWTASAPLALTLGDRDRSPLAVRELDDRLWVGFQSSNPDPPGNQGRFVRVTDALGQPVAPAVEVLPSPDGSMTYGSLSLWTNPRTREHAAMSWTEGPGCRVVRLDDAARPTGASVRLGDVDCASVVRHARGWTYLTRGSSRLFLRLQAADLMGTVTRSLAFAPDSPAVTAATRVTLDDDRFVGAWSVGGTDRIALQRYGLEGDSLGVPRQSPTLRRGVTVPTIRLVSQGATLLVAWLEVVGGDADVVVARTDLDGAPMGSPVSVATIPVTMGRPTELGLAVARGLPAVTWLPNAGAPDGLRVAVLDPVTLRPTATVDVPTARFPHNVFLRGTTQGFVVVFGAIAPPTLTQVWTAPVRCVVPG